MQKLILSILTFLLFFPRWVFAQEGLRDIKPPVAMPGSLFWIIVVGLLILLAGAAFWYFKVRSKQKAPEPEIALPPWEWAAQRLDELVGKNYPDQNLYKEFFSELSDIVRHYIEERFKINAPDMTTPEFLAHIEEKRLLMDKHRKYLKDFLNCCDMVKFAKYGPSRKETDDGLNVVREFVRETKLEHSE